MPGAGFNPKIYYKQFRKAQVFFGILLGRFPLCFTSIWGFSQPAETAENCDDHLPTKGPSSPFLETWRPE